MVVIRIEIAYPSFEKYPSFAQTCNCSYNKRDNLVTQSQEHDAKVTDYNALKELKTLQKIVHYRQKINAIRLSKRTRHFGSGLEMRPVPSSINKLALWINLCQHAPDKECFSLFSRQTPLADFTTV